MSILKSVEEMINDIIKIEGGYVNHPNDRGGPTNFGITQATYSDWIGRAASIDDIQNMKVDEAVKIYLNRYYNVPKFDLIYALSPAIAIELTDTGINMGPSVSSTFLQRSLNVLNLQGTVYPNLTVDGRIGQRSVDALGLYLQHRRGGGEIVLLRMLNCLQGARYIEIAESRPKNQSFVFGWFNHRISL